MVSVETLSTFWDIVAECLVEFHGLDETVAHKKTKELRQRLRKSDRPAEMIFPSEIIYHDEPFHIACELMGKELDLIQYHEEYKAILAQYGW